MKKKNPRLLHVGKNTLDREEYRRLLSSYSSLDKTEEDPTDFSRTNESSLEQEKPFKQKKVTPKSKYLKVKDFFSNNWAITILGGLILAIIVGGLELYVNLRVDNAIIDQRVDSVENEVDKIESTNDNSSKSFENYKKDFEIFRAEVNKDLEYIKKKLKI